MKKISKRIIDLLILIVFIITIFFSYNYLKQILRNYKIINNKEQEISLLKEEKEEIKDLKYYKDYYNNDDIIGSLNIPNTNINTLLVQSTDNKYYLNHSLKKEYDIVGSIYVDYRTNLNSKQINIYGHNSNVYDVMFKELEKYLDEDYYKNHKYIELWNGLDTNIYEIFSIQIVSEEYEHYEVNSSDWNAHINKLSKSIYKTEAKANIDDQILVIQTCLYNKENSYLIINSKKI